MGGSTFASAQQIEGYSHRHWDAEEGAPPDINAIAQTRDGFLWLGTSNGLYRFDGLGFEKIEPSTFNRRQSNQITALAAGPDGALWVGYDYGGVSVYRHGRLDDANGEPHPVGAVFKIAIDRDGNPWVAVNGRLGPQLKHLRAGRWQVHDSDDWLQSEAIHDVLIARDGTIWIAQARTISRLRPGAPRPEKVTVESIFPSTIAEDNHGEIWVTTARGVLRLTGTPVVIPITSKGPNPGIFARSSLMLEDGKAWISGQQEGLIRTSYGNGSSGRQEIIPIRSRMLFRDREGTIWGGGSDGLVNYIRSPVLRPAIRGSPATGFTGGGPGNRLLVATDAGVYALDGDTPQLVLKAPDVTGLCSAGDTLLAISQHGDRLGRAGRWSRFNEPFDGFASTSCAIAPDGRIWSTVGNHGIFHLQKAGWERVQGWEDSQFIVSDGRDGLYANDPFHAVRHLTPGRDRPVWSGDAIAVGFVKLIKTIGPYVYIGGEKGLARFDGRRFVTLEASRHPWLSGITGLAIGSNEVWLMASSGIVRLSPADFDRAFLAPAKPIAHQIFGAPQGIQSRRSAYEGANDAALDSSGRPWFITDKGVFRLDPARYRRNDVPPPVTIRSLEASGMVYGNGNVALPAGTSRIQFDYVALSLTDPTRNAYRYKLDGVDQGWVEAGGKRQANYTGLGPGQYRFQVIAANADGVWNTSGAAMTVTIAPFFWETWWFKGGLAVLFVLLLWIFVQWRIRVAAERARQRIEDRLAVREHIAQELHDTLLQGFQGLMLRFQSIVERLPIGHPARTELESTLDRADDVLQEGRDRVRFLREETTPVDLGPALSEIAQHLLGSQIRWSVKETGNPHPVCAPVADDITRIVSEAAFNALRHAEANSIEIEIVHGRDQLTVSITDDGIGLDPAVKSAGRKEGHYGFVGMRERALRLGAAIQFLDADPSGTRIRLTVPARIAYR